MNGWKSWENGKVILEKKVNIWRENADQENSSFEKFLRKMMQNSLENSLEKENWNLGNWNPENLNLETLENRFWFLRKMRNSFWKES